MSNKKTMSNVAVLEPVVRNVPRIAKDPGKAELEAVISAIEKAQATIEFRMDGTILTANDNFLHVMAYRLDEIKGKHHSMFVDETYARSSEYRDFWAALNRGEFKSAEFKRLAKGGREVWIQAAYSPILDLNGKPFKVVKFATDVTAQKLRTADYQGQIAAIGKSEAVVEFQMDGTIITANDNFQKTLGYSLEEIKGKHHSMFVDLVYARSGEYKEFWEKLNRGEFEAGEYKRIGKGGREVWIQASYNAILDLSGKPFKVVKYATDITGQKLKTADYQGQIAAIGKSEAVIEFLMDGTIITANDNFQKTVGYSLAEIKGKHHSMFVSDAYASSPEYREFWAKLNRGEYQAGEFKRIAKGGREVWIQASYNAILDLSGKPFKVVKYATDVTEQKLKAADYEGQMAAIEKSQAVIEFLMDGTIVTANENFLKTLGYSLEEIKGKHHSMFVDLVYARSGEYKEFWANLNRGEFEAGEYKRIGKGGREVWIQASYNSILDLNGKPFKVVKYATDITGQKLKTADYEGQIASIGKSEAVIEFQMDGTIVTANENFLKTVGYSLEEIKGKHHSMFVDLAYAQSGEYREFWAKLNRGEFQTGEYKRIGRGGREVWIQASYNAILDLSGKPFKVVKYATDVTAQKLTAADYQGQIAAIGKSQAVIEFQMDGTIVTANENFLKTVGYSLEEIKGKHHSMFVDSVYARSGEYKEFWAKLNRGEFQAGEYKRIGKGGREVWIQASYNSILDLNGKPFKVVKYATNVTEQKLTTANYEGQIAAIGKSQAVIEFLMDGTIISANDNFLKTVGYSLEEIKGRKHSMFVGDAYASSNEYRELWAALNQGEYQAGEFKRIGKGGREIWIQASYNPILDLNDKPVKVVKYASDITKQKVAAMEEVSARLEGEKRERDKVEKDRQVAEELQSKVRTILEVVKGATAGDLTRQITVQGEDAIGQMGEGLTLFFQNLRESIQQILQNAHSVGASSEELTAISQQMAGNAEETATQARVVTGASQEVSNSVSIVATGSEEMLASIREIAKNSNESARVAKNAVAVAESANTTISKLGESSFEIGKVIKVITSIAQQTNLLALNATIEAARAGEAGKGFAVVANEVKELAKETAKATEEIGRKIEAIQSDTKSAVQSIAEIGSIIHQINDISNSIASAVEEQTATTNEMGRNINEAARGANEIASNISGVAQAAQDTTAGAIETQTAAKALGTMAAQLQGNVARFKI